MASVKRRRNKALESWFLDDELMEQYQDMIKWRTLANADMNNELAKLNLLIAKRKVRKSQRDRI